MSCVCVCVCVCCSAPALRSEHIDVKLHRPEHREEIVVVGDLPPRWSCWRRRRGLSGAACRSPPLSSSATSSSALSSSSPAASFSLAVVVCRIELGGRVVLGRRAGDAERAQHRAERQTLTLWHRIKSQPAS